MGLPLQPDLQPWGRGTRWLVGGVVVAALMAVIAYLPSRPPPPEVILSRPDRPLLAAAAMERLVATAQRRIWIVFYVVRRDEQGPVDTILTACATAAARGVEVCLVLDHGADADGRRNEDAAAWCQSHGLRVVFDEDHVTTHAKVLLVDDAVWIGSHNATRAALATNREAAVILRDPAALRVTEAWFAAIPGFVPASPP